MKPERGYGRDMLAPIEHEWCRTPAEDEGIRLAKLRRAEANAKRCGVMSVDDAMTAIVNAESHAAARAVCHELPLRTLRMLCDLMHVEPPTRYPDLVTLVVSEARA